MAPKDKKTDESESGSTGSGGDANSSGTADNTSSAMKPGTTPVADATTNAAPNNTSENTNDAASQGEGRERVKANESKAEVEVSKDEKSFATEFNKARVAALGLGLTDAAQVDNYATSVANKTIRGEKINPIEEVRNVAGPMTAAIVQANMELQLSTSIAVSDHNFIGGGFHASKQQVLAPVGPGGH